MFYVFQKKNWRWCRYNTVRCHKSGSTVSGRVTPSPKGGGRGEVSSAPSKSATDCVPSFAAILRQAKYCRTYLLNYLFTIWIFTWIFKYNFRPFAAPIANATGTPALPRYATDDNGSRSTTEIWERLHGVPCLLPLFLPFFSFPLLPFPPCHFLCNFSLIQVRDLAERCKLP